MLYKALAIIGSAVAWRAVAETCCARLQVTALGQLSSTTASCTNLESGTTLIEQPGGYDELVGQRDPNPYVMVCTVYDPGTFRWWLNGLTMQALSSCSSMPPVTCTTQQKVGLPWNTRRLSVNPDSQPLAVDGDLNVVLAWGYYTNFNTSSRSCGATGDMQTTDPSTGCQILMPSAIQATASLTAGSTVTFTRQFRVKQVVGPGSEHAGPMWETMWLTVGTSTLLIVAVGACGGCCFCCLGCGIWCNQSRKRRRWQRLANSVGPAAATIATTPKPNPW